jgi:hypothetical protein
LAMSSSCSCFLSTSLQMFWVQLVFPFFSPRINYCS